MMEDFFGGLMMKLVGAVKLSELLPLLRDSYLSALIHEKHQE